MGTMESEQDLPPYDLQRIRAAPFPERMRLRPRPFSINRRMKGEADEVPHSGPLKKADGLRDGASRLLRPNGKWFSCIENPLVLRSCARSVSKQEWFFTGLIDLRLV
jgi:hypothetical protein